MIQKNSLFNPFCCTATIRLFTYLIFSTFAWLPGWAQAGDKQLGDRDVFVNCGELRNAYGPWDYTNPEHYNKKLPIVTAGHFSPEVEALVRGVSAPVEEDLDYTLRAFPNHHRALYAMARFQLRNNGKGRAKYTMDCYVNRALRFKPDDAMVSMIYGIYLHKSKQYQRALKYYKSAAKSLTDSAELHYNLGLLYVDLNDVKNAQVHAEKAYKLGYPLPGLKRKLKQLVSSQSS